MNRRNDMRIARRISGPAGWRCGSITFHHYVAGLYAKVFLSINTTATSDQHNTVSYTVEISVEAELEQLDVHDADVIFVTEERNTSSFSRIP